MPNKTKKSRRRQREMKFDSEKHCFICTGIYNEFSDNKRKEKNDDKRKVMICDDKRKDKTESTRNKTSDLVADKTEQFSLTVQRRVSSCSDLLAVGARHYIACRKKLGISSIASLSGSARR